MTAFLRRAGLILAAIAAGILAILQFSDQIYAFTNGIHRLPRDRFDHYVDYAIISAIVLYIVAIPATMLLYWATNMIGSPDIEQFFAEVSVTKCGENDLVSIFNLARSQFGEQSSELKAIERLHAHCPNSFWKVHTDDSTVGYFIIYSLTKSGEDAVVAGHYNGAHPDLRYLHKSISRGNVAIVGAVVGLGRKGRGAAFGGLTAMLQVLGFGRIYARAVTPDGLAKVRAYGFKRVDGDPAYELGKYYRLDIPQEASQLSNRAARRNLVNRMVSGS
jgi:hypothetical protein